MKRAIELARMGSGRVAPNPTVGAVIVSNGEVIGEGFHAHYGGAHAEINAIQAVRHPERLRGATIYVTLEPCSHYGKTPPCADRIIAEGITHVVIGTQDPFPDVAGRGIERLRAAGVKVIVGVLEAECREAAKAFICTVERQRPFVILKWAQSADGFIDRLRTLESNTPAARISNEAGTISVHRLRNEVDAIMVGTQTALMDNPSLTTRYYYGRNPLRVVLDRKLIIPESYRILDGTTPTVVFTEVEQLPTKKGVSYIQVPFDETLLPSILNYLYLHKVQILLVEGGAVLLQSFLNAKLYDEVIIEQGKEFFGEGVKAPAYLP